MSRMQRTSSALLYLVEIVVIIAFIVLSSCPIPLNRTMVAQVKDNVEPTITIQSPAEGSSYPSTVVVTGLVTDFSNDSAEQGRIDAVYYEVLATAISGVASLAPDGTFGFQFSTASLSGPIVIKITAEDWNGNKIVASLTLVDEGAIPSFRADPENGSVALTWDAVPLADHYTIYYEKADIIPSVEFSLVQDYATSPTVINNLKNGDIHTFLLRSHSTSGADNWSAVVKAIPLSPTNLAPNLTPEPGAILVEWNQLSTIQSYEVWKSTSPAGPFQNVSGVLNQTWFRDSSVQPDQVYYYAVKPAYYCDELSGANGAQLSAFPPYSSRGIVGSYNTGDSARGIVVSGNYAYVADGYTGLRIFNISTPSSPNEVGFFDTGGWANSVDVYGNYAYVGDGGGGLRIIDITNKSAPSEASFYSGVLVYGVDAEYPYVYLAAGTSGLVKISVSPPFPPAYVGTYNSPDYANGVYVIGSYAYVADDDVGGLRVVNTSTMIEWKSYNTPFYAEDVVANYPYAYVCDLGSGLRVIDVSQTTAVEVGYWDSPQATYDAVLSGSYAYLADGGGGMRILNISNPANPFLVGYRDTPGTAFGIAISGSYAYIADGDYGLQVLDIAAPTAPAYEGSYDPASGDDFFGVDVNGSFAYLADASYGLRIIDIQNPSFPSQIGDFEIQTANSPRDVVVNGSYAYIADYQFGLRIFDVTDRRAPFEAGSFDSDGAPCSVAVDGSYAYLADGGEGLRIYDVSNPTLPTEVGFFDPASGWAFDVVVKDTYAYVADGSAGVRTIDISNFSMPTETHLNPSSDWSWGIDLKGSYLYVADGGAGLTIYDISGNPAQPAFVGSFDTGDSARRVTVSDTYAYVADNNSGLRIIDISNPARPTEIGFYDTSGTALGVDVSGSFAYVADGAYGLQIFDLTP